MVINWNNINTEALSIFQEYLAIDTSNPPGNEKLATDFFIKLLLKEKIEFQTFTTAPNRNILYAKITGNDSNKGLMLCSHSDVVPVEKEKWTKNPFGGEMIEDKIYGRGAIDMKSCTIMQFIAFILIKRHKVRLNRDLIFCIVPDEEIGSKYGMSWLVDNHPELLDIEYSLNEGGYGFSDIRINNQPLFGIGYREKKICWIKITAFGIPGHGSQPHGTNATAKITNALNKIIAWHQENYNENFQSKDDDLNNIMNEVIDPELVAMNQSTLNITRLNAGNKHNVIPAKAEAILDCRLPNYIDSNEFIHTIKNLVNDDAILFENLSTNEDNLILECEWDTELIHVIKEVLNNDYPNNITIPLTSAYGTDNRFLRNIGINAYGFIPSIFSLEERSGFHNHDEYITKENFINGCKIMYKITEKLCSKKN